MKYRKIKLAFKENNKRFYRIFYVDNKMNLTEFGCAILTSLYSFFEHSFYFENEKHHYNPRAFIYESRYDNDLLMDLYCVEDLGKKFSFCYDTGENYLFEGKVIQEIDLVNNEKILLIDGAGKGIFEDNISTLYAYLDGKIEFDDVNDKRNIEHYFYSPWNIELERYSDFDKYDIDEEQKIFKDTYKEDIYQYKKVEEEYFDFKENTSYDMSTSFTKKYCKNIISQVISLISTDSLLLDIVNELICLKKDQERAVQIMANIYVMTCYEEGLNGKKISRKKYINNLMKALKYYNSL
ncbi:MAG: hypothetical protein MR270_04085 [Erysipelotrichaceae bacterium]|nr:hypothetical protein [Erysipelotrichaceae bacterium]